MPRSHGHERDASQLPRSTSPVVWIVSRSLSQDLNSQQPANR
ncbi:MAG: hypothetical protein ACKV2Q_19230 [Planctomycetaceae bacterium]